MLFMGIDIGTQGVRTVIVNEKGNVLASEASAFRDINIAKQPGYYEQSAEDWWLAAAQTVKACTVRISSLGFSAEDISTISIDGTSGTIVPLDTEYKPLCNAFMYNDMRASAEALQVHEAFSELEKSQGFRFNASFSLPRILWIRNNLPEIYSRAKIFAHQADYIAGRLCGEYCVSDYSNALKTGYDLVENKWPEELEKLGLDNGKLPVIVPPGSPIARISGKAAEQLGLSGKTQVVGGSTDGYASALAAGAVRVGDWASIIGTTLVLKGITEKLVIDPAGSGYSHKLPSGAWMFGGASNIGGRCLNNRFEKAEFALYDKTVDVLSPTGVLCYPLTGKGERFPFVDPEAVEFIVGNAEDRKVLYTALMEGVGFAERLAFERMESLGCNVGSGIFTTGGACRSEEWLRIRASLLNRQLKVPAVVDAAMGSAMLAASSHFGSLGAAASALIRIEKVVDPVYEKVQRFNELYGRFYEECRKRYRLGGAC